MDEFKIRSYTKTQLAQLYFPDTPNAHSALNHLMVWVKRCKPLMHALEAQGYSRFAKSLSAREVATIVEYLGEPGE